MREKILKFLHSEDNLKTNIEELKEILDVSSSGEFKEMIKAVNQLLDEAALIENSQHEITLIENTNYIYSYNRLIFYQKYLHIST